MFSEISSLSCNGSGTYNLAPTSNAIFFSKLGLFLVRDDSFLGELILEEEVKFFVHLENVPSRCKDFISTSLCKYPVSMHSKLKHEVSPPTFVVLV